MDSPFQIDLDTRIQALVQYYSLNGLDKSTVVNTTSRSESAVDQNRLFDLLQSELLTPRKEAIITALFSDILPLVFARELDSCLASKSSKKLVTFLSALATIGPCSHDALAFAEYLLSHVVMDHVTQDISNSVLPQNYTLDLVVAIYRLIRADKLRFEPYVNKQSLYRLIERHKLGDNNSYATVYISLQILSAILDSSDTAANKWFDTYSKEAVIDVYYGTRDVDYKYFALLEAKRISSMCSDVKKFAHLTVPLTDGGLSIHSMHPLIFNIGGLLVPNLFQADSFVTSSSSSSDSKFVRTPMSLQTLSSIARVLKSTDPVLIKGPEGSGKTFYTEQVAEKFGRLDKLVRIHLGDQTDAKILIGTYSAGEQPGSFEWRAGILTVAVKEGRWVLIEDIDKAPTDILSVLLSLLDQRELTIPSRGETIRANKNFRIFATMRTQESNSSGSTTATTDLIGQRLWTTVETHELSADDLMKIISKRFPLLESLCGQFVSTYSAVKSRFSEKQFMSMVRGSPVRQCCTRDLVKWAKRVNNIFLQRGVTAHNEELGAELYTFIFSEAVDCFASSIPNYPAYEHIVTLIGNCLDVPSSRISLYLTKNVPQLQNFPGTVAIGRAQLPKIVANSSNRKLEKSNFALTNHSLRLLEQIAVGVSMAEPLLLVGETGTGKTTVIQYLARLLGKRLISINLSQQTEIGDLLGGYKPVEGAMLAAPLIEQFDYLFDITFSAKKNAKFIVLLTKCYQRKHWGNVIKLWKEAIKMAHDLLGVDDNEDQTSAEVITGSPVKKRKLNADTQKSLFSQWLLFADQITTFESQIKHAESTFLFQFVEGLLVQAVRQGDWVLLDEMNLASPDTLECISDLLVENPTISLVEKGDAGSIKAHSNFRLFGCMNPATDVGKRDLPMGLRSRFTEIYVTSPDRDISDLLAIVDKYIGKLAITDQWVGNDVAQLYLTAKRLAEDNKIVDGANQKPHFSIRTLSRTLQYCSAIYHIYGLRRSLYEGFCMSFLTLLDRPSEQVLSPIIVQYTIGKLKNMNSVISQIPPAPQPAEEFVQFRHYWLQKGPQEPQDQTNYIITPSVEKNLLNLTRATSGKLFPILIQGPTSSGKTSMINYLAKISGHKFVRINNHEHTDLQEYLGSYVSDDKGQLKFQEGALVNAIRNGHWIVLDELNLAPTDVLEALNRLLDDNRELLIPDTQEIVKPHPEFMLFATQNPPGLYGGRKVLSRAFRNRFLELHFDDIPENELEEILRERCQIAPSYAKRIVDTYRQLAVIRQSNRLFEQKNSFATLRDLFRWAQREAVGYEQLALNGYILLAERVRNPEEKAVVKDVLEKIMRVKLNIDEEYEKLLPATVIESNKVVWTKGMKRLLALLSQALKYNEPVLLVGETGCGKTTICQILAEYLGKNLYTVNAHQNTETGDIIGAQRPVRNRSEIQAVISDSIKTVLVKLGQEKNSDLSFDGLLTAYRAVDRSAANNPELTEKFVAIDRLIDQSNILFEWVDGSLIQALKQGDFFLLDEISLADDSVLERLNSVLEPERSLLLTEKGYEDAFITASDGFQFLATMNPGGDYGKKELSPALRNRFTEIWVPSMEDFNDVLMIVEARLDRRFMESNDGVSYSKVIVSFGKWFGERYGSGKASSGIISLRDIISWVEFMNRISAFMDAKMALFHGACMVFIDSIGSNSSASLSQSKSLLLSHRRECLQYLSGLLKSDLEAIYFSPCKAMLSPESVKFGDFSLPRESTSSSVSFTFDAPTTAMNALRVVRAMQMRRPILLEGSPGVGKTSLVTALARVAGRPLTRINLSEQTDLIDLFGADAPVEGEKAGEFLWKDAPFLRAMQKGEWVLLDEMNLASQSVLEGLNACLDHRGSAYIPELDKTFQCHPDFLVFAAQNPQYQGGGRKGLPKSFVNRFSVVYVDILSMDDLQIISTRLHPSIPENLIESLTKFVADLDYQVSVQRSFGQLGSPFEFNLRDTMRWLDLFEKYVSSNGLLKDVATFADFFDTVIASRFRSRTDREKAVALFESYFGSRDSYPHQMVLSNDFIQMNGLIMARHGEWGFHYPKALPLQCNTVPLTTLLTCIENKWPVILVGPTNSGKTELIRFAANVYGGEVVLKEFSMNSDVDSTDLLGGFDQVDDTHSTATIWEDALAIYIDISKTAHSTGRVDILVQESITGLGQLVCQPSSSDISASVKLVNLQSYLSDAPLITSDIASRISALLDQISAAIETLSQAQSAQFRWFDGTLIKAIENGHWLVLDNANLCNPSVLDRLNSLLEPNGCLMVNECSLENGEPRTVLPHPNFRLFLTVNPKYGELSRAMRNRGVEIYLDSLEDRASSLDRSLLQLLISDSSSIPSSMFVNSSDIDVRTLALADDVMVRSNNISVDILSKHFVSVVPLSLIPKLENWFEVAVNSRLYSNFYLHVLEATCSNLRNLYESPYVKLAESSYSQVSLEKGISTLCPTYVTCLSYDPLSNPFWGRFLKYASMEEYHRLLTFVLDVSQTAQLVNAVLEGNGGSSETYFAQSALVYAGRLIKNKPKFQVFGLSKHVLDVILQWLSFDLNSLEDLGGIVALYSICEDLISLTHSVSRVSMDESEIPVYKRYLEDWIESHSASISCQKTLRAVQDVLTNFALDVDWQKAALMDRLWRRLRGTYPTSETGWKIVEQILALSKRLDAVCYQLVEDSADEVKNLRLFVLEAIQRAYSLHDALDEQNMLSIVEKLDAGVTSLELQASLFKRQRTRIFTDIFKSLFVVLELRGCHGSDVNQLATLSLYSDVPLSYVAKYSDPKNVLKPFAPVLELLPSFEEPRDLDDNILSRKILSSLNQYQSIEASRFTQASKDLKLFGSAVIGNWRVASEPVSAGFGDLLKCCYTYCLDILDLDTVTKLEQAADEDGNDQGSQWIAFSLDLLRKFIPDFVYDPAIEEHVRYHRETNHLMKWKEISKTWTLIASVFYGDEPNNSISKSISAVCDMLNEPTSPHTFRPRDGQINVLFREIHQFIESQANDRRIAEIIANGPEYIVQWRANTSRFIELIKTKFSYFSDITSILEGILLGLRLGVSLKLKKLVSSQQKVHDLLWLMDPELVMLPDHFDFSSVEAHLDSLSEVAKLRIVEVLSFNMKRNTSESEKFLRLVSTILKSIYYRWTLNQMKLQEEERAKTTIYKDNSEQNIEDDFKKMFPDFDEVLEVSTTEPVKIEPNDDYMLMEIYSRMFSAANCGGVVESCDFSELLESNSKFLSSVSSDAFSSKSIGQGAMATIVQSLANILRARYDTSTSSSKLFNFYHDANSFESNRIVQLTEKIQNSVLDLLERWPDHYTLLNIKTACGELLLFPISTPIARLLQKVEQILTFLVEWETYASQEVSFKSLVSEVTDTIISWRKLELSTWPRLFDFEDINVKKRMSKWWYYLFENLIFNPSQAEENETDLVEIVKLLSIFISQSAFGEFHLRLDLLRAFAEHSKVLGHNDIYGAIRNVVRFYEQFSDQIKDEVTRQRKSLEKDLKEIIQLAQWKDTNIAALKESSKRSHSKLYKIVRKYRDLIGKSVSDVVDSSLSQLSLHETNTSETLELVNCAPVSDHLAVAQTLESWLDRPDVLAKVTNTTDAMRKFSLEISNQEIASLYDLAVTAVEQSETLRKETPTTLTEETRKVISQLRMEKAESLNYMIKQLKYSGLNTSVKSSILAKQDQTSKLLTKISPSNFGKSDTYFYRILEMLPRVRSNVIGGGSGDISPADLQRCLNIGENLLASLLSKRNLLAQLEANITKIEHIVACSRSLSSLLHNNDGIYTQDEFTTTYERFGQVISWLPDIIDHCITISECSSYFDSRTDDTSDYYTLKNSVYDWKKRWSQLEGFYSYKVSTSDFGDFVNEIKFTLATFTQQHTGTLASAVFNSCLKALPALNDDVAVPVASRNISATELNAFATKITDLSRSMLVAEQQVYKLSKDTISDEEEFWYTKTQSQILQQLKTLHSQEIATKLDRLLDDFSYVAGSNEGVALLGSMLPFVVEYLNLSKAVFSIALGDLKTTSKSAYMLFVCFYNLAKDGFCGPQEPNDEEHDSSAMKDGTGLGDGSGAKNNSNDVEEDEDLTEHAQTENKEKDDGDDQDDDNDDAVSIEGDMAGEAEDYEAKDDEENSDDDDDDDDEKDLDEEIGDIDELDPNQLDEKMWDDQGESNKEKQTDKDVGSANDDMQGVDDEPNDESNEPNEKESDAKEEDHNDAKEENDQDGDSAEEEDVGMQEDNVNQQDKEDVDPFVPESDVLALDENLNLDDDADADEEKEDGEAEADAEEINADGEAIDEDLEKMPQDTTNEQKPIDEEDGIEDADEDTDIKMETEDEDENIPDDSNEPEDNSNVDEKPDAATDDEEPEHTEVKDENHASAADEEMNVDTEGLDGPTMDEDDNDDSKPEQSAVSKSESSNHGEGADDTAALETDNAGLGESENKPEPTESEERDGDDSRDQARESAKEIMKQLGSSLEEFYSRREEIKEASQKERDDANIKQEEEESANVRPDEFEHVEGEESHADTQALGAASSMEQNQHIDDSMRIDEEDEAYPVTETEREVETVPEDKDNQMDDGEGSADADIDDISGANNAPGASIVGGPQSEKESNVIATENFDDDESAADDMEVDSSNDDGVELELPFRSVEEAREMWKKYDSSTQELALTLCEQLRLILEPTQATKLRGDFKTGKRLNMKRIIPYIASQFKKDKIWLRRTKPSKRDYQVMISLDDSKSMSESKVVDLAFQTIAMVSKAFNQLEVGQIAITRFGENTKLIHPFDKPFSPDAGIDVLRWFGFDENKTDVYKLLSKSISLFEAARQDSRSDNWQLEIIISDGICEDHDNLRRLVRKALEEKIIMVFVVVDSVNTGGSILEMNQVKYETDASGNMALQMERYLDHFPFDYYIIVRDIRELPMVLSSVLRQYFSQSME